MFAVVVIIAASTAAVVVVVSPEARNTVQVSSQVDRLQLIISLIYIRLPRLGFKTSGQANSFSALAFARQSGRPSRSCGHKGKRLSVLAILSCVCVFTRSLQCAQRLKLASTQ